MAERPRPSIMQLPRVIFATLLAALACAACSGDDPISKQRPDTGVSPDAGAEGPLPLAVGMTFTYRGHLGNRERAGRTRDVEYGLGVRIAKVTDRGSFGESTLEFTATGSTSFSRDWGGSDDFDSWIARLGPTLANDRVGPAAVVEHLSQPPAIPPAPRSGNKVIPVAGTFFLDARRMAEIAADFDRAERAKGRTTRLVEPETDASNWVFESTGPDAFVYASPPRRLLFEYDRDGYLVRLDEWLGTSSTAASLTAFLRLERGPKDR